MEKRGSVDQSFTPLEVVNPEYCRLAQKTRSRLFRFWQHERYQHGTYLEDKEAVWDIDLETELREIQVYNTLQVFMLPTQVRVMLWD